MQKENLSALIDGEYTDIDFVNKLLADKALQESWQRYHLIRDMLRNDVSEVIGLNIAEQVAMALKNEAPLQVNNKIKSQPSPALWPKMAFWSKIRPWANQLMQIGLAACVSLIVIVGVQQYQSARLGTEGADSAVLGTVPLGGLTSPVSYGSPAEVPATEMRQVQEQRERINQMLQNYELQRRLHAPQLQQKANSSVSDDLPNSHDQP